MESVPTVERLSIPHYIPAPPTRENLEYADLATIDFAKAATPDGRAKLALQVRDGMREHGFVYIINHGMMQEQNDRVFDIADVCFTSVSDEEKKALEGKVSETGAFGGYKLRKFWHLGAGVYDQVEHYNIDKNVEKQAHPRSLQPLLPEITSFAKHNHFQVLHPLLRLLAIGLELPEDIFVKMHDFEDDSDTAVRFMKYYPRSDDDEHKTGNVWLKGHTDFGSITILWSQPVTGLQILSADGKWRWIRHIDNALVINIGDCLEFLSGGYYRATIHRVIQPARDQRGYPRVGAFYFVRPNDSVKLAPLEKESSVLQKFGVQRRCSDEDAPTVEQWRKGRTISYGKNTPAKTENGDEEEYINGVLVKHYN